MPTHCPLCGVEVVKPEGEVMHRCPNRACPSRGLETLINWVSAAMDIEGVGEQFVRRLWDLGLLRSMPALYRLTVEQIAELEGYGEISATKIVDSIEQSKQQPFSRVLFGLNIPDVGWVTARNLARHFGNVDRLLDAGMDEIEEVEGIGPDRAESIAEWFEDPDNRALVRGAARAGSPLRDGGGGEAGRGPADGQAVRRHRHAREVHARGGEGRAGGARRKGLRLRLGQDDRAVVGRGARRVEADEGAEGRGATADRS